MKENKTQRKLAKAKSWSFENINKIEPLARLFHSTKQIRNIITYQKHITKIINILNNFIPININKMEKLKKNYSK